MNPLYIQVESNVISDDFSWIHMAHHTHKLSDTTLEEENCEFLCLELLLISYNAYFISLNIEDISFLIAPQIVEVEQNL